MSLGNTLLVVLGMLAIASTYIANPTLQRYVLVMTIVCLIVQQSTHRVEFNKLWRRINGEKGRK